MEFAPITALTSSAFDALREKVLADNAKIVAANSAALRAEFGDWLSERDILRIIRTRKDLQICDKCNGSNCTKDGMKPILEVDAFRHCVNINSTVCKFERLKRLQARISKMFKSAGISANYTGKTFEDYEVNADNRDAVDIAKKFLVDDSISGLYLYGLFGTGKTFLAAILANEFAKRGKPVLFYKVPFLVKDLQAAMFDKTEPIDKERELLKKICEVPVLILDDFGMSDKFSTYATGRISMIVDARYENDSLKTIITTNYKPEILEQKLNKPFDGDGFNIDGSRIVDRLTGMCEFARFAGKSFRRK